MLAFPKTVATQIGHIRSAVPCIWRTGWHVYKAAQLCAKDVCQCVSVRHQTPQAQRMLDDPGTHTSACHVFKRTQYSGQLGTIFQLPLPVSQFSQCHGPISYGPMSWPLRFLSTKVIEILNMLSGLRKGQQATGLGNNRGPSRMAPYSSPGEKFWGESPISGTCSLKRSEMNCSLVFLIGIVCLQTYDAMLWWADQKHCVGKRVGGTDSLTMTSFQCFHLCPWTWVCGILLGSCPSFAWVLQWFRLILVE